MSVDHPFHTTALVVWLGAAVLPSTLTRNPIYLMCALGLLVVLQQRMPRAPEASAWRTFAQLTLFFVLVTSVLQVVLGGGGETVLFELPAWRYLGDDGAVIFQLGGPVTLENLLYSLTTALALFSVILALATFNTLVDHHQLLRSVPPFLHQAATVVSIAVSFMPQLMVAQREIRQAQALRGHRVRGLRDLLPLLVTLLSEGLERAMALAESMEARGFSAAADSAGSRRGARWAIASALALLLAGAARPVFGFSEIAGRALMVGGAVLMGLTLWDLGRRARRSRHRRELWRRRDTWLVASSSVSAGGLLVLRVLDGELFAYSMFPAAGWPSFDVRIVLLMLLVLVLLPLLTTALAESEA